LPLARGAFKYPIGARNVHRPSYPLAVIAVPGLIDGVFADDGAGLRFHPACRLTRDDVAEVVAVVARRIERLLARRGLTATTEESGATDPWAEEAPTLAGLAAASVQSRVLSVGLRSVHAAVA